MTAAFLIWALIILLLLFWLTFEFGFNRGMKWADDCHKGRHPPVGARLWW